MKNFFKKLFPGNQPITEQANDQRVMSEPLINAYNAIRSKEHHASFCYAPTVNMLFAQDGHVKACCHNEKFSMGQYPQQSIREIWNGPGAQALRQHMQNYDLSHGCDVCAFDMNLHSFDEVRARFFDERPRHTGYPAMMEFLLSNQCNLECVMCTGEFSSLIRQNREHLPPLQSPYNDTFVDELKEFIPHLQEARFSGSGEAFSIDLNYKIWELIAALKPGCIVLVQTNGTILTQRVKNILSRCRFDIGVSLDSLQKETYESIRINANFNKVMDNIRYFSQYCAQQKTRFTLAMCPMRQNVSELPAFIELCNELGAHAIFHKVWAPEQYALHNLPAAQLQQIVNGLSAFTYTPQNALQKHNLDHYRYYITVIETWLHQAREKEQTAQLSANLQPAELLPLAISRMQQHLATNNLSPARQQELLNLYTTTTQQILATFTPAQQHTPYCAWYAPSIPPN